MTENSVREWALLFATEHGPKNRELVLGLVQNFFDNPDQLMIDLDELGAHCRFYGKVYDSAEYPDGTPIKTNWVKSIHRVNGGERYSIEDFTRNFYIMTRSGHKYTVQYASMIYGQWLLFVDFAQHTISLKPGHYFSAGPEFL